MADVPVASSSDIQKSLEIIANSDVILFGGVEVYGRLPGYDYKWNSANYSPAPEAGSNMSSEHALMGGVNSSKTTLSFVSFIQFYELRNESNPEKEIVSVKINGQKADCSLLLPKKSDVAAIQNKLNGLKKTSQYNSQLDLGTPILFINIGPIKAGEDLHIEYETKPRGRIFN